MTTTSDKILKTIKEAQIAPDPRWKFLAKNSVLWLAFALALVVGSLSFAVMVDMLVGHDWDLYSYLHTTFLQYLIFSLPYLWIVSLGLFSWIAYYNFVHTKGWYRHRAYLVILASIILSIGIGLVFFYLGMGRKIDQSLSANVPYYNLLKLNKKAIWYHPNEGLLGGTVKEIKSQNELDLIDNIGQDWDVEAADVYASLPDMRVGEKIKIIGTVKSPHVFVAKEIREWESSKEVKHENVVKKDVNTGLCTKPDVPCATE